jgi:hypothetical protein
MSYENPVAINDGFGSISPEAEVMHPVTKQLYSPADRARAATHKSWRVASDTVATAPDLHLVKKPIAAVAAQFHALAA